MASEVITGKTQSGFEFGVLKKMLTNAEFLELFADVQNGDANGIFELVRLTLGKDQKKKLYDHVRDEDGCVPVETLASEFAEIVTALGEARETKN